MNSRRQTSGTTPLALLQLKYVQEFRDRYGVVRRYFRRKGWKPVALPGLPGSDEFMVAYRGALTGVAEKPMIGAGRTLPGTIGAAVAAYYLSAEFAALAKTTQATYRGLLEQLRTNHGTKSLAGLERRHVKAMMAEKGEKTAAANNVLRAVKMLVGFAISMDMMKHDPAHGVKAIRSRSKGFHSWTDGEIEAFKAKHPIGTKARLALHLLLDTSQRRGDVVKMGPQHIRDGVLTLTQGKTGAVVEIPVHPDLAEAIAKTPSGHLTFLVTAFGKPFTAAGFGNLFREWCNEAKLPARCSAHGLRKAFSRRLAEARGTAHEIKAFTGHKTLAEVSRYTDAADKRALAKTGMEKIARTPSVKLQESLTNQPIKASKIKG